MAQTNKSGFFLPIESNKNIENYEPRPALKAAKGAFSDEARDALAVAVSKHKDTALMDNHTMEIKYYESYVYVVARNTGKLPAGTFNKELLQKRLEDIVT